jgi:plasmid stabilization system protein ParE
VPSVALRPRAEADALEQVHHLAGEAPDAALRFIEGLAAAFVRLERHPRLGRPWPTRRRDLREVRRLLLTDFPISIFYRLRPEVIDVIRILHHRRDFPPDLEP